MGQVANAGLVELVAAHNLSAFVETGTGWGVSVRDALAIPALERIHSIEIDQETYERNKSLFASEPRVQLWHGDSRELLPEIGRLLWRHRVCWYLDAHFPGSARQDPVPMLPLALPPAEAVPVVKEVQRIAALRSLKHDF